jgi:hypothetical protein
VKVRRTTYGLKLGSRLAAAGALLALAAAGCVHSRPPAPGSSGTTVAAPAPGLPPAAPAAPAAANAPAPALDRSEQIRNACLDGRRMICGRVLDILTNGVIVDSGYTDLMREPLNRSWVIPGNVAATKNPNALEANVPGTPCIGTVLLNVSDLPKRGARPIHQYDYIVLLAFPAGEYEYVPVPPIKKTIRKFTGTLEMAVAMNLAAEKP